MTANRHSVTDWKRLGTAVQAARLRARYDDMKDWAALVGRSTRQMQGLERGEQVGAPTLRLVETALSWRPGYADAILEDPHADLAPEVRRAAPDTTEPLPVEHRALDEYTTEELLNEVGARYSEMAYELHRRGIHVMTRRQEGNAEVWETMSPAQMRREGES